MTSALNIEKVQNTEMLMLSHADLVVWSVNIVAEKKESMIDIRLTQIDANEDWSEP